MANLEQADQKQPAPSTAPGGGRKLTWILGVVLVVVVGALGYYWFTQDGFQAFQSEQDEQGEQDEAADTSQVVATVNDKKITRNELDDRIDQLVSAGQLPPLEELGEERIELERSMLEQMVASLLLAEDAQRQGVTVSEDAVNTQYDLIAAQVGTEDNDFEQQLAGEGITPEELKDSLREQLVLEAYFSRLREERNISVSDDEVQDAYDTQLGENSQGIAFEDVEPQIRQQLEQQKLGEILPEIVAELRERAEVQILI